MGWLADIGDIDWAGIWTPDTPVLEIVIRGTVIYLGLFVMLRIVLRRESGTMGITDLLVIVLIADAAQNGMADDYTSIPDGLLLVLVIILWSWVLDWASYRCRWLERLIRPAPLTIIEHGRIDRRAMRREFITMQELRSQLREQGIEDIGKVKRARMEPDGRLSVIEVDGDRHDPPKEAQS